MALKIGSYFKTDHLVRNGMLEFEESGVKMQSLINFAVDVIANNGTV